MQGPENPEILPYNQNPVSQIQHRGNPTNPHPQNTYELPIYGTQNPEFLHQINYKPSQPPLAIGQIPKFSEI